MTCSAPLNINRGVNMLAKLDEKHRRIAIRYAQKCVASYIAGGLSDYCGHKYDNSPEAQQMRGDIE